MLVLVTGATGRIGSHLTRALVEAGHTVRALVVPGDPRAAALDGPGVEQVVGRLESLDAVTAAARGVAAVYHLGGALTSRGNTDEEFFEYNVRGTFNLLMAVRDQAPRLRRFVYASSDAVYFCGGTHGACYLPIDEAHPRIPGTIYGASKVCAEELCLSFWRGYAIPVTNPAVWGHRGCVRAGHSHEHVCPLALPARRHRPVGTCIQPHAGGSRVVGNPPGPRQRHRAVGRAGRPQLAGRKCGSGRMPVTSQRAACRCWTRPLPSGKRSTSVARRPSPSMSWCDTSPPSLAWATCERAYR